MSDKTNPTAPPNTIITEADGTSELRTSNASGTNASGGSGEGPSKPSEVHVGEAPGTSTSDAMDLDLPQPPSRTDSSVNVDSQSRIDKMSRNIDSLTDEITEGSSAMLAMPKGEARTDALDEIKELRTLLKELIDAREDLLVAQAAALNRSAALSAARPLSSPSAGGGQPGESSGSSQEFPSNLPAFQWVGMKVFDPRSPVFDSVDACLLKFEDIMKFNRLNFDEVYPRLVPPMLSSEQRTWYASFSSGPHFSASWNEFKAAVKARYGISVVEERDRCANELLNIRLLPNEQVRAFIDRFVDLRRRAMDQAPSDHLLVQPFLDALPAAAKNRVNTVRQSQGIIGQRDIDVIANVAREAINTMSPSELGESAPAFVRTAAGSAASQWASPAGPAAPSLAANGSTARSAGAASTSPRAATVAGRVTKSHGKAKKSCTRHQGTPHNHDTSECKLLKKGVANHFADGSGQAESSARGKRTMLTLAQAREQDRCRICGAYDYSAGHHECNTVVRTGDAEAPAAAAASDAVATSSVGGGCLYHGPSATHGTDQCKKLKQMVDQKRSRSAPRRASEHAFLRIKLL